MKPKIIAVVGPTASGKTALGILLAKRFDGEVISADSRQVYKGMDIGTGKIEGVWKEAEIEKGGSISQLFGTRQTLEVDGVPHWGLDLVEPDEEYSVSAFKSYAERKIADIVSRGKIPILVGGTGLWVSAVVDNLSLTEVPPDPELRAELEKRPAHDLYGEYKQLDPAGAEVIDKDNKRRLIRALEVTKKSGKPFSALQTKGEPKFDVLQIGIEVDKEELAARISERVDGMVANGLVNEVRALKARYGCDAPAMSGIGYREICAFLNGESSLADAIEDIKKHTRQYARRQLTWFRRDDRVRWMETPEEAISIIPARDRR